MNTEKGHLRNVRHWPSTEHESLSIDNKKIDESAEQWWHGGPKGPEDFTILNLFKAIDAGDLTTTVRFFSERSETLTMRLTQGDTPLHKAVLSGHKKIVKEIVSRIDSEELRRKNDGGVTCLTYAAAGGSVEIAKCLVAKCSALLSISNNAGQIPVVVASLYGHKDLVLYLYRETPPEDLKPSDGNPDKAKNGAMIVTTCIIDGVHDIALDLIGKYPSLAYERDFDNENAILALAQRPSAYRSGANLATWQWWIYSCIPIEKHHEGLNRNEKHHEGHNRNEPVTFIGHYQHLFLEKFFKCLKFLFPHIGHIYALKLEHGNSKKVLTCVCKEISKLDATELEKISLKEALFKAVENGIVEYVEEMMKHCPDVIWYRDREGRNIFFCAVAHRQEKIFSLIYKLRVKKNILANARDYKTNNILHMAATLAPSSQLNRVAGAALQMQRELQWFKEVESLLQPKQRKTENSSQETPQALFTVQHKDLVKEGEKWMKETAVSCTVVATLIATMMFSSAFTIPGGFSNDGTPVYLHRKSFLIFIVSDAISLFTSSISILMFLGILRSRYREGDFLRSHPTKLIIGLASLFLSMATMMVTFVMTLTIMLGQKESWVSASAVLLAIIPVIVFGSIQFPILMEIFKYTYGQGIFDKPRKCHRLAFSSF